MTYKTITVDVDVDLDDFDEEDLIDALENNGYKVSKKDEYLSDDRINSLVTNVYLAKVLGAPNLDEYLNELFNEVLNRSI